MTIYTSNYASTPLSVDSVGGGIYYTRNATNVLNATTSTAVDIGTLTQDSDALNVTGKVLRANATDYYKFTLDGDNLKLSFSDLTDDNNLRVQILDSDGNVVADSEGTDAQQKVYDEMTSSSGYDTTAGDYYAKVTYSGTSSRSVAQEYSLTLYSGDKFTNVYNTTASAQTKASQAVTEDTTMTYAADNAEDYSNTAYNSVSASADNNVMIGWLYENQSALSLTSKLTDIDNTDYYSFTFQKGSSIKLAFENKTTTSDQTAVRIQILDITGTYVIADNEGTDAQQAAYTKLMSSDGLDLDTGTYLVKVSYGSGADKTKDQTYNFKLYSGDSYTDLYETTASAQTFDNAYLSGDWDSGQSYSQTAYLASFLYGQAEGSDSDVMSVLKTIV